MDVDGAVAAGVEHGLRKNQAIGCYDERICADIGDGGDTFLTFERGGLEQTQAALYCQLLYGAGRRL